MHFLFAHYCLNVFSPEIHGINLKPPLMCGSNSDHIVAGSCTRTALDLRSRGILVHNPATKWSEFNPGADRTQVGPMLTPWTLLSGVWKIVKINLNISIFHYFVPCQSSSVTDSHFPRLFFTLWICKRLYWSCDICIQLTFTRKRRQMIHKPDCQTRETSIS